MIVEESVKFLRQVPPFQFLDETSLEEIASNMSIEFFPKNTMILHQDGPPSESLRVIKKGGVKVFLANDDEIVIDYKSEGDSFGYISLLSGDRSRANVMAIEDTLCYLLPRDVILRIISREPSFGEYFMKSFFQKYLDKTYKEMRNKNLLFKEGEKMLYTTPVGNLARKELVTAPASTAVKDAAAIMSENRISSIVLTDGQDRPVGIITDRDLRDKVVARGADLSMPCSAIMSDGIVSIDSHMTCFDALARMIELNIHHLLVTESGRMKGIVTNHDFMVLQGSSPLSLLKSIDRQQNIEDLPPIYNKINLITSILLREGVRAVNILRIISELHDKLLYKIIDISIKEIGDPPVPFAFFVYGTEGRKEETFKIVFRCALAYRDITTFTTKKEMERFCSDLLDHIQRSLKKCILPLFDTKPLGEGVPISADISEWRKNILNALKSRDDYTVLMAKKFLDLRSIYGDKMIIKALRGMLFDQIRTNYQYKSIITEYDPGDKSLVGFFKQFVVNGEGEQSESLDIKQKGIIRIADALRALAIMNGLHETSTIERLNILSNRGLFPRELRADVASAFEFLLQILLHAQLAKKDAGLEIDNLVIPGKLTMLEKKSLKEVFQLVPVLQKRVRNIVMEKALTV
jgi:CBS domain-containing protein